jgi:hypothetical protein
MWYRSLWRLPLPEDFWNVRTVVEGRVLLDPTVSTRRRKHDKRIVFRDGRSRYDPRSQDGPC